VIITTVPEGARLEAYSKYTRGTLRLGVAFVPEGASARQRHGGPLVPGPWAYTYPLSYLIARQPARAAKVITAAAGDLLRIDGHVYRLTDDNRMDYPRLHPVDLGEYDEEERA
jgi:hypothetical protein